jgi:hypothetical protein
MRSRALLLCLLLLLTTAGAFAHRTPAAKRDVGPECGRGVTGPGFHVFACMSGGAAAGHPHPKELLVVRRDGLSVAYPAWRVGPLAASDEEVVAGYDDKLVRVTSGRLVPLVTRQGLARALHQRAILIMGFKNMKVDARGDLYFFVSTLIRGRYGCQNRSLERLTGGRIRQIWASSSPPNDICY